MYSTRIGDGSQSNFAVGNSQCHKRTTPSPRKITISIGDIGGMVAPFPFFYGWYVYGIV
jgi:hypothetical protein